MYLGVSKNLNFWRGESLSSQKKGCSAWVLTNGWAKGETKGNSLMMKQN